MKLLLLFTLLLIQQTAYSAENNVEYIAYGMRVSNLDYISTDIAVAEVIGNVPAGPIGKISIGVAASAIYAGYALKNEGYLVSHALYYVEAKKYSNFAGSENNSLRGVAYDLILGGFHGPTIIGFLVLDDKENFERKVYFSLGIGY